MSSRSHAMKSTKTQLTEATDSSEVTYPQSVADMLTMSSSPSQRTQTTDPSSSMRSIRSSLSSHAFAAMAGPPDNIHVRPLSENPYCFEESDEDDEEEEREREREKKAAKKHKKKKKSKKHNKEQRRSSNESSDRQSSRRTVESSDSHLRSDRQSSRRTVDSSDRRKERRHRELEPLDETLGSPRKERRERTRESEPSEDHDYVVSPRKERRDRTKNYEPFEGRLDSAYEQRYEQRRSNDNDLTSEEFLRIRRERHERMREEGLEVETLESRRERRERHDRRKDDGLAHHEHHHRHARSVGASRHHHGSSTHRHHSESHLQTEYPAEIQFEVPVAGDVDHAAASLPTGPRRPPSSRSAEMWSPDMRSDMYIPTSIDVPTTIDVIVEQSPEDSDSPKAQRKSRRPKSDYDRLRQLLHEQSEKSDGDNDPSPDHAEMLEKLHPLIAASDDEFQEAFDNLAKDSVFDDNFEKAFNEFSEHYLALSPWGEDDSMKDKCDSPDEQQDFIQIPLTPVSREGLTSYISKDKKYYHIEGTADSRPRTPVIERGYLKASALDNKHADLKKKEGNHNAADFVEVSRTPYYQATTSSGGSDPSEETPEGDDRDDDAIDQTPDRSTPKSRSVRKLLRGRRQTKAKV